MTRSAGQRQATSRAGQAATAGSAPLGRRPVTERVGGIDWPGVSCELDDLGVARIDRRVLSPDECHALVDLYPSEAGFRSTIDMARHRFGKGEYRYFSYPLPEIVAELRAGLWPHLLPIARQWAASQGRPAPWPDLFDDWLEQCHAAGQRRPTPLMLRYGPGDWNALHRDLYGELVFPLQVVIGLNRPGVDYTGGEVVLVEQRPRAQSRATAIVIGQGEGLVLTTRDRPIATKRGWSTAPMRHGVSVVRSGQRHALGLIFHDAE